MFWKGLLGSLFQSIMDTNTWICTADLPKGHGMLLCGPLAASAYLEWHALTIPGEAGWAFGRLRHSILLDNAINKYFLSTDHMSASVLALGFAGRGTKLHKPHLCLQEACCPMGDTDVHTSNNNLKQHHIR